MVEGPCCGNQVKNGVLDPGTRQLGGPDELRLTLVRPVHDHAADRLSLSGATTVRNSDVNAVARGLIDNLLHFRRRLMTHHRALAGPPDRRPQTCPARQGPAKGRVNAWMHVLPDPGTQPVGDLPSGEARSHRLVPVGDPGLNSQHYQPVAGSVADSE
jgi:hypothetical protein